MGLKDEFEAATTWIKSYLDFGRVTRPMSVFEINIRMLGGLLSVGLTCFSYFISLSLRQFLCEWKAYDLSGEEVYLQKATDLGNRLLPAFNTPTGLPKAQISLASGRTSNSWTGSNALLAEFGTLQLEFRSMKACTAHLLKSTCLRLTPHTHRK